MAEYTSGAIHFTGLGNGTDFDTMITQLKAIEEVPAKRLLKWKADWQERMAAFQTLRTEIVNLRAAAAKMNSVESFLVKTAESSSATVASATAQSGAQAGVYRLEVNQVASNSIWSMDTGFTDNSTVINTSGQNQAFVYEYKGKTRSINVAPGTTLKGLENLINNDTGNPGVKVSLIKGAGGYTFQMRGMDQGAENSLYITQANLDGFGSASYAPYTAGYTTTFTAPTDVVNTTAGNITYNYTYNGQTRPITVPPGTTLEGFAQLITADNAGVTASVSTNGDGKQVLTLTGSAANGGMPITAEKNPLLEGIKNLTLTSTYTPEAAPGDWHVQQSKNAKIRINGWPAGDYLEVGSNTVSDVADGMTFSLKDVGSTVVTVTTDTAKIKENVLAFMDAVNAVRTKVLDLTKYDDAKDVKSPEYATSLFQMQKGSILTGNYGVQLLASQLKQATAGTPIGFSPLMEKEIDGAKVFIGDIFSSLSQIGIKTMAEGSSGTPNFGLLVLNTDTRLPTLDSVLAASPEAVAEFFAAKNKGVSDSANFSFSSQIDGMTKPGIYDVKYNVDASGNIINPTINGKPAKYNTDDGTIGISAWPPQSTNGAVATATFDGAASSSYDLNVTHLAKSASTSVGTAITNPSAPINTSGADQTFTYTYDGQTRTVSLKNNESLNDLVARINNSKTNPGVTAKIIKQNDDTYTFSLDGVTGTKTDGTPHTMDAPVTTDIPALNGSWNMNATSQDAQYTIAKDGSAAVTKTSKSNTISDAAPGMVFTVKALGTATISTIAYNDADGVYIHPDNLTEGSYSGTVRIKQGKINELLAMLDGPPGKSEQGMLGKDGALGILDRNYKDIVKNIDAKVEREDARIVKWERLTRLRFSRLEATLSRYDNLSKSVESQIKQLSSSSK